MWYLSIITHEKFGNYSLGEVPSQLAIKILMATMCSAVQLLVELTMVEGQALLGSEQDCRDIPLIIPGQVQCAQNDGIHWQDPTLIYKAKFVLRNRHIKM